MRGEGRNGWGSGTYSRTTDLIIGHENDEQKIPLSHLPFSLPESSSPSNGHSRLTSLRFFFFLFIILMMTFFFCFLTFPHSISPSSFLLLFSPLVYNCLRFSNCTFLSLLHLLLSWSFSSNNFFQSWNHWIRIFIFIHFIFPAQFLTTLSFTAPLFIGCSVCISPLHSFCLSFHIFFHSVRSLASKIAWNKCYNYQVSLLDEE